MSGKRELVVTARRYKGGTWSVFVTYPDGSWEHRRGLVDHWAAMEAVDHAISRVETDPVVARAASEPPPEMVSVSSSRSTEGTNDGDATSPPGSDTPSTT